ncbi:rod shape-determining protein MreD [Oscillatoria sp. FACHB-1406]|uniref:rod shape-determining protein MreD n=1 Tax=Oscillatoria sp. FACHB-1406 TaxID=2692846 RepID=UPI0016886557|nr:rod shape-determining protein MreD [Oscillatoria sp. FACHB-1406]MBD2576202.1 rod shape-determining protein MreD [Oscillatoria sp. FACHB-1406]
MIEVSQLPPNLRKLLNWAVIIGSALICLLLLPMRLPGTELVGVKPDWVLIWVVVWSAKRLPFQGAMAGLALGLILDGMTAAYPTHALSLGCVGFLSARLYKQGYTRLGDRQEDIIAISLLVLGMVPLAEAITALQFLLFNYEQYGSWNLAQIWLAHQKVTPICALLSSLWAPVIYYPLNRWWQYLHTLEKA